MTALETELKKKKRSDRHFQWAREELETNQETYSRRKVDIIRELASRLEEEGEIETKRISTEIVMKLRKHVTQRYVNKVLDERYKDELHVESARSRRTSSAKIKQVAQTPGKSEANILAENESPALENAELKEALKRKTTLINADQVSANELAFIVPKEKFNELREVMEISRDSIRLVFDKSGVLERAESDIFG